MYLNEHQRKGIAICFEPKKYRLNEKYIYEMPSNNLIHTANSIFI